MKIPLKYRALLIITLILLFSLSALYIRLLPMANSDPLTSIASDDPLYNLRQVESLLTNDHLYPWFDPMTSYPMGESIVFWGPLFQTIIAQVCIITGTITRIDIISTGLLIAPIMAAIVVPIVYFIGTACGNWKTGLISALFISIISGQFFYRSMYGYMDHHVAEVLFSTMFCLFYMWALLAKDHSKKYMIFLAGMAGMAFLAGLLVMPTMILFAMITAVYTGVQFLIDTCHNKKSSEYLVLINTTVFSIAICGFLIFGIKHQGTALSMYSIGHVYAYSLLIGATILLYIVQKAVKEKYHGLLYPVCLAGLTLLITTSIYLVDRSAFSTIIADLSQFFEQTPITNTITEAAGWTLDLAWVSFNYGMILAICGAGYIIYHNIKKNRPEQIFFILWSLVILLSTWQHMRYEYYLAVNIAILAGIFVTSSIQPLWAKLKSSINVDFSDKSPVKTYSLFILIIGISVFFIFSSVNYDCALATHNLTKIDPEWKETMDWMQNNTPITGIDYYRSYNPENFSYPNSAYGIMSAWDYGHMITVYGNRIPVSNPFQRGMVESANYFMSSSEESANKILDQTGSRYVITDTEMLQSKFSGIEIVSGKTVDDRTLTILYHLQELNGSGLSHYQLIFRSSKNNIKIFEYIPG